MMTQTDDRPTIWSVMADLVRHPMQSFVLGWNWKSALTSAVCRATIFLAVNLPAGTVSGLRAMTTELVFRGIASGVFGTLTQAFCQMRHAWIAVLLLPAFGHTAEYLVHRTAGTARLGESIVASIVFTVVTTSFNLFAMRRGALIVGHGAQSLLADLRRLPRLIVAFVDAVVCR